MEQEIKENIEKPNKISLEKLKQNPWMTSTIALGIIAVILLYVAFAGGISGNTISEQAASEKLVDFLNTQVGGGIEALESQDLGNIYQIVVSYNGQQIPFYITKDGEYFVRAISPLSAASDQTPPQTQAKEIPKSDKPTVELFVMSYCPYGTQSEKGIIPVLNLLGDKIDANIRFVHYTMHGEKEDTENFRQLCIRENYKDKYLDYLNCFLDSDSATEPANASKCIKKIGISETKINNCMENDAEALYAADSDLSQGYNVQGSPTLIINGVEAQSARSPAAYLQTICSAFTEQPEKCQEKLSEDAYSPGFGYGSAGSADSNTAASCG